MEAILLSTFVLISQNRMQAVADKRADLDLQISLLAEHEVTAIGAHLGVQTAVDEERQREKPTALMGGMGKLSDSPCRGCSALATS